MILLVCRKFRAVVVVSLLVAGLGLTLPPAAAAGQADRARFSEEGLFTPAKVMGWLTGLWQDLSGLWAGGVAEKGGDGGGDVLPPGGGGANTTNGGGGSDEGPAIDPNGG